MRTTSPLLLLTLFKKKKKKFRNAIFQIPVCLHKYYRKDHIGLLLNPYLLVIYLRKTLNNKSTSFLTQQWILQLRSEFLLSHATFSIFSWALVKQTHFLIADPACVWWDLKNQTGPIFIDHQARKIKKPNFALRNFNRFEGMAGIKSRSLSSKCDLVNSSAGDPTYGIFSKSFSHRMPLEDYK